MTTRVTETDNRPLNHRQLSRRTVLRGVGVALGLPLLEAMIPTSATRLSAAEPAATATAGRPPVRMACLFFPNGVWMPSWIPKTAGTDFELPFSLEPLAPHRAKVAVLSGLDKAHSRSGDGHYAKTANFLTGLKVVKTTGKEISVGGMSMDQLAAARVGSLTPMPSLELGCDPVISGVDSNVGYTRLYGSHISWRSAQIPVAKEINPRLVYERLFGSTDLGKRGAGAGNSDDQRSLLDAALADARELRGQLGRDDQFKLDEYLDSVRSVEKRLEFLSRPGGRTWQPPSRPGVNELKPPPAQAPEDYREHVKLMLDLLVLAFWTDSTRVATFMMANDVSGRNFSFVDGVKGGHHDISHHSNDNHKIEQYQRINRWHVSQLAYLCGRLDGIREGDRTLLDNAMVMMGSSMSDGNAHDPNNLPVLVAGGGGGGWKLGRHIASGKGTPLCNLYVTMLRRMSLDIAAFGDSSGVLAGLE